MDTSTPLRALVLNCTLKLSPEESSTDRLIDEVVTELGTHGVASSTIRVVDRNVKPGVEADMGPGDAWPAIREQMLESDILILATPTWMGHATSVAQRVMERFDAELSDSDEAGRLKTYGKVAAVIVVGNEDGAHKICADVFQALNDVGFSIPAAGCSYWNGEAMGRIDYKDLDSTPESVASANKSLARNAAHLARLLKQSHYPAS